MDPQHDDPDLFDDRLRALESVLGPSSGTVLHASIPFFVGAELGGAADVVGFERGPREFAWCTCELIGGTDQLERDLGTYELLVIQHDDAPWGAHLIGRLAYVTTREVLRAGETMDLGSAAPRGSAIRALLFLEFARLAFRGRPGGVLLCLGITATELQACLEGRRTEVEAALRARGVYPFTDHARASVL